MKPLTRLPALIIGGCLCLCLNANAEPALGRLFTTPAERANLDHLRSISKTPTMETPPEAPVEQDNLSELPSVTPSVIRMQGYVKRNDGKKSTVWVNGEAVQENTGTSEVQVGKLQQGAGNVALKLKASGKNVNLKAGQVYVPETDSVAEIKADAKNVEQESGNINRDDPPAGTGTRK
ncbi:MAG: hypothetical protein ABL885_15440 [Methylophilaceae bacterium]